MVDGSENGERVGFLEHVQNDEQSTRTMELIARIFNFSSSIRGFWSLFNGARRDVISFPKPSTDNRKFSPKLIFDVKRELSEQRPEN